RRAESGGVKPQARTDSSDPERMRDEVLARSALLAGVALAGERERPLDLLSVDRLRGVGGVLLDHGEQVPEERPLVGGQLTRDCVRPRRARAADGLADPRVTTALLVAHGSAVAAAFA